MNETDFVDIINTLVPGEKHLPGMQYCGPGTNLYKRLNSDGSLKHKRYEPVDRVDMAALKHDLQYSKYFELEKRLAADKMMLSELKGIKNPTCKEQLEMCIVIPILHIKCAIDNFTLWLYKCFKRKKLNVNDDYILMVPIIDEDDDEVEIWV